ncbi:MaoC family dehydratase N-terminal domain-containing protein [Rhodococcus pseudokoreensis]|uniref:MaoC family dehydratase N-terminal domain-containing protein n=1 Tax=Rhodococcus pseudokoreensis TaxID=2811421 RepID=A0A974W994_9NOCA|nr:MaoC/PaaZ C-terminal domain-containing protein [Rhodococcus pseudokoreensis]QSE92990.1 MaoC family dehydratase N-terminal domain-containing protein [Rhodococcus pseudokoreensis]
MDGLYFEDYYEGQRIETPRRTVTDYDISAFVNLCGFLTPTFMDLEYVNLPEHYAGRIAPGMLTLSFAEGLILSAGVTRGTGLALLGLTPTWKAPVYAGDTIQTQINVVSKRLTSRGDRGVVTTENVVVNSKGATVATYTSVRMIKSKTFGSTPEEEN